MISWASALLCLSVALGARAQNATSSCTASSGSVYDYSILHNNESDMINFSDYAGKAIVIVNTASF